MKVTVAIPGHPYEIVIEKGGLNRVGDWLRTLNFSKVRSGKI